MKESKYLHMLQELSKKPVFSSKEGKEAGIPPRMLAHFCSKGLIERVSRGIYKVKDIQLKEEFEWEDLTLTVMGIPTGVVCLISALCVYDLTDEIMREFWIAVPHTTTAPHRSNTRIIRMRNMTLGQTTKEIAGQKVKIFDRERTIVDAFRYLDKEIAVKALQAYLKSSKEVRPDLKKLKKYAKAFKVNLTPYIIAFTT